MMQQGAALSAFAALSQEHRLQIVRLLVQAGPEGLPAGALGEKLAAGSSKMSFHLSHLEQAGLVASRRSGRQIIYSIKTGTLSGLIAFLLQDCCGGRPEFSADIRPLTGCSKEVFPPDAQGKQGAAGV